ncbi:hypothetical protein AM500_13135 [Bacillus sp. FJAT-18017]|nr:hypothetical protein AM500_13135 [Bacillus sp. FJAT-18017]
MKEHFEKNIKWYLLGILVLYIIPRFFLYEWKGLTLETNWGIVIQIFIMAFLFLILNRKT